MSWTKEVASADRSWLASQQQQQVGRVEVRKPGAKVQISTSGSLEALEDLQRLTHSLQLWAGHARTFPVLVTELIAHVKKCAATVVVVRARGLGSRG